MTTKEVLASVIYAVESIVGLGGPGGPQVSAFLSDPDGASDELFAQVAGLHLAGFFANATVAFGDWQKNLWTALQQGVGDYNDTIPMPTNFTTDRTLGDLTSYLMIQLEKLAAAAQAAAAS